MTDKKHLRIVEERTRHSTKYWVEKAVTLFGFILWWSRTTISYFSSYEHAKQEYEDHLYGSEIVIRKGNQRTGYDLLTHIRQQRSFSKHAFGPGARVEGLLDHIAKEMEEVRQNPEDLSEWMDIASLSFDGAWRTGASPEEIVDVFEAVLRRNQKRKWPDWRTADPDKAIEHK